MKTQKAFKRAMLIFTLAGILCLPAIADTQAFEVWGPAGEGAGVGITTNDDVITVNFIEGETTDEMADRIVEIVSLREGFVAWRVGNKIYINSQSKITIEKVNVRNVRVNSVSYNNGQAQIARNNMFHFNGTAAGDGQILFSNDDLVVTLNTFAGQTAMQVVDALTDALNEIAPSNGQHSYGMEYNISSFGAPGVPIGPVELGIWTLGNRSLLLTECTSTDSGITVYQEAVTIEAIPTLSQWGVIVLIVLTLSLGTVYIFDRNVSVIHASIQ